MKPRFAHHTLFRDTVLGDAPLCRFGSVGTPYTCATQGNSKIFGRIHSRQFSTSSAMGLRVFAPALVCACSCARSTVTRKVGVGISLVCCRIPDSESGWHRFHTPSVSWATLYISFTRSSFNPGSCYKSL